MMIAELVLVSTMSFQVTSYRSVPEQTDSTPFETSIGLKVRKGFCAVSQDVLGKSVNYGDVLYVEIPNHAELSRFCFVADTMNKRNKRAVDFWVATKAEERAVNVRRGLVYKLKKAPKRLNSSIGTKESITNSKSPYEPISNSLKVYSQLNTAL